MDQEARIIEKLDAVAAQLSHVQTDLEVLKSLRGSGEKTIVDHETRIRSLERVRWLLHGAAALLGYVLHQFFGVGAHK